MMIDSARKKARIVTRSLKMKYGCIASLSAFELIPRGLLLPLVCSVIMCTIARADSRKGSRKCSEKNRFSVALFTEKPPQINSTISCPTQGIALIKLVITVAPHKDI